MSRRTVRVSRKSIQHQASKHASRNETSGAFGKQRTLGAWLEQSDAAGARLAQSRSFSRGLAVRNRLQRAARRQ